MPMEPTRLPVPDTPTPVRVLVIDEGNGARQILNRAVAPVRAVIVGVVDDVELAELA